MSASSSAEAGTLEIRGIREAMSTYLAWRPEWPLVLVVGAAWVALLSSELGAGRSMEAMQPHQTMAGSLDRQWVVSWTLMCVAMMLPLALPGARHVAVNSFDWRRWRATAVFASAFVLPWVAFGVLALLGVHALQARGVTATDLGTVVLLSAAVWQLTSWKRRAVLSCSRTVPLPPFGWRADAACAEFGLRQSLRCMLGCWPLMTLMAVAPHGAGGLWLMTALTVLMTVESRSRARRRLIPWLAVPLLLGAVLVPVLG